MIATPETGSAGFALSLDVPVGELVTGDNTFEVIPVNLPMDYPPIVSNVDLFIQ